MATNLKCHCGYEAQNEQDLQKHKQTAHQGSESGQGAGRGASSMDDDEI